MANTNIPNNPAFFVPSVLQAQTQPLGPQQLTTIEQLDSNGLAANVTVTMPAPQVVAHIVNSTSGVPSDNAAATSIVVPFACQVVGGRYITGASAGGGAGDTFAISCVTNAGVSTIVVPAQALSTTAHGVAGFAVVTLANGALEAGGTLTLTTVKGTSHVAGDAYIELLPL